MGIWRRVSVVAASLLVQFSSEAAVVWCSGCQTVTNVTAEPVSGAVLLTLARGISGCSAQDVIGAIQFVAGQAGVTDAHLSTLERAGSRDT